MEDHKEGDLLVHVDAEGKRLLYEIMDQFENEEYDLALEEDEYNCRFYCSGSSCCMCGELSGDDGYECDRPDGMECVGGLRCLGTVNGEGFLPCWWDDSLYPDIEDEMGDDDGEAHRLFLATCEDVWHTQNAYGGTMDELRTNWNQRVRG